MEQIRLFKDIKQQILGGLTEHYGRQLRPSEPIPTDRKALTSQQVRATARCDARAVDCDARVVDGAARNSVACHVACQLRGRVIKFVVISRFRYISLREASVAASYISRVDPEPYKYSFFPSLLIPNLNVGRDSKGCVFSS
jgi:hypothetical protein